MAHLKVQLLKLNSDHTKLVQEGNLQAATKVANEMFKVLDRIRTGR